MPQKKSSEVAHDLHNISVNNQHKIITLDIKDLYVNLPIKKNILAITKFWLNMFNNQPQITQQILELIKTIPYQNYFQYDKYYQPTKGIALGSPIRSTTAEIYLQYFEETVVKHWTETKEIIYYK